MKNTNTPNQSQTLNGLSQGKAQEISQQIQAEVKSCFVEGCLNDCVSGTETATGYIYSCEEHEEALHNTPIHNNHIIRFLQDAVISKLDNGLMGSVNKNNEIVITHKNMFDKNGNKRTNAEITYRNGRFMVVRKDTKEAIREEVKE